MKSKLIYLLGLLVLFLIFPSAGYSSYSVPISGQGTWGSFSGNLSYADSKLTVSLTNTSSSGYITGFALNNPNNGITGVSSSQAPSSEWQLLGGPSFQNTINAQPFGYYDVGMALGGSWEGGGNPNNGIGAGQSASFSFTLLGNPLTLSELLLTTSLKKQGKDFVPFEGGNFMSVRFRGFENGQSDKVPAAVAPEPSAILFLGTGLAGLLGFRARRHRRK